jgi:hypothetical protein
MNELKNYSDYIIEIDIPKESFPKYTLPKLLPVSFFGKFDVGQYINDWANRMHLENMNKIVPDEYKIMLTYIEYYEE